MSDNGLSGATGSSTIGTLTDQHGNVLVSAGNDADGTGGVGSAFKRFIQSGVWNGDFAFTPHSPDASISDHNVLPYWTLTRVSGTSIDVTSVADTSSGSGRVIRFEMSAGSAGDEAYLEQVIPVNASRGRAFAYYGVASFLNSATPTAWEAFCRVQFLTSAGVATGSEFTLSVPTTNVAYFATANYVGDIIPDVQGGVPADAASLRLRVGVTRGAAAVGTTDRLTLCEVRRVAGDSLMLIAERDSPASYNYLVGSMKGGIGAFTANNNAPFGGSQSYISLDARGTYGLFYPGARVRLIAGGQTLLVGDAIIAKSALMQIQAAGPITLTSAPTIADGDPGEIIIIRNIGANAITLSDQGTLANSNLRLSTATFALGTRDSLTVQYDQSLGDWIEIARTNVI